MGCTICNYLHQFKTENEIAEAKEELCNDLVRGHQDMAMTIIKMEIKRRLTRWMKR